MQTRYLKRYLMGAALVAACIECLPAHAQYGQAPYGQQSGQRAYGQNRGTNGGQQDGQGTLPLPQGITNVISVDAQNTLLVEYEDPDNPGQKQYQAIRINHVYSGGIAKILGGDVIPTETFVSPSYSQQNGNGGYGGFGGQTGYGNNGYTQNGGVGFYNPTGGYPTGNQPYGYNQGYNQNNNNQYSPYGNGGVNYNGNYLNAPVTVGNVSQILNGLNRIPR
ncbi:MAG: hypothetical protein JO316_04820 [Abitibacteriaceae bacterium]|nr:hypothetical protein [Abditibacteriaceae bacterium]